MVKEEHYNAYKRQVKHLKQVLNDSTYGLERILRLFLCSIQFIYPALIIRTLFGKFGALYIMSETIFYILNLIFLSDIYSSPVSYRRSILFLFLHYVEVVMDFSVIYIGLDLLNKALTPLSAVYFSFVTNTTLGYGDYHPNCGMGQIVVIAQLLIFIMFVVLFINYFSSGLGSKK
ncbi:MAG: hypothetical protein B1H08_05395 [Candidatus Omnitrophica bacterium 4484_171]|nr:MAG: hypothetical protein B1H08_05395 [Candidatus Omnitrophica bacterium 4484_171]